MGTKFVEIIECLSIEKNNNVRNIYEYMTLISFIL